MYHVSHQGQQFGPYTVEQINQYLAQGTFDASSHVWDANTNGWVEIGTWPGVILPSAPDPKTPIPQSSQYQGQNGNESKGVKLVVGKGTMFIGSLVWIFCVLFYGGVLMASIIGIPIFLIGCALIDWKGWAACLCPCCGEIKKNKKIISNQVFSGWDGGKKK